MRCDDGSNFSAAQKSPFTKQKSVYAALSIRYSGEYCAGYPEAQPGNVDGL